MIAIKFTPFATSLQITGGVEKGVNFCSPQKFNFAK